MSADEIRRLAQQAAADKITNKVASHYGMAESCSKYETALLDFAAMVERCEKVIETYKGTVCEEFVDIANFVLKNDAGDFNDILLDKKGATDERK